MFTRTLIAVAVAVAEPGRKPPRFVGTVTTVPSSLTKSLLHVADKAHAHIVYEAGPSATAICAWGESCSRTRSVSPSPANWPASSGISDVVSNWLTSKVLVIIEVAWRCRHELTT